jgi:hypothetical protein
MRQTLVICALLLLTTLAVGQTYNPAAGQQALPPLMGSAVSTVPVITFPPPYGGLLLQSGYATTAGWGYPPLLATPTASFSSVSANPVGATDGTSNLQVGATNSTLDSLTRALPAMQTTMEVSQPGAVAPMGYAPPQSMPQAGRFAGGGAGLGAAQFDVVNARAPGDLRSLAEVARAMRKQPKPARVRTFTNADVQSLKDREKPAPQKPR